MEEWVFFWNPPNYQRIQNFIKLDKQTFYSLAENHTAIPVYKRLLADVLTPVSLFLNIREGAKYPFPLESVEGGENLARFSFIGTEPEEIICTGPGEKDGAVDPLDLLRERMNGIKQADVPGLPAGNLARAGQAADLLRHCEITATRRSPRRSRDEGGARDFGIRRGRSEEARRHRRE